MVGAAPGAPRAAAESEELYDPVPPPSAAYLRVVHARPAGAALEPEIEGRALGPVCYPGATPFVVVERGRRVLRLGSGGGRELDLEAGHSYTVALLGEAHGDSLLVLDDTIAANRARATLVLYNLSGLSAVHLATADRSVEVLSDAGRGARAHRRVNALRADFAVFSEEGAMVARFDDMALERGAVYSAIVTGPANAARAIWVASEVVMR